VVDVCDPVRNLEGSAGVNKLNSCSDYSLLNSVQGFIKPNIQEEQKSIVRVKLSAEVK
jgi:hypothetical protein